MTSLLVLYEDAKATRRSFGPHELLKSMVADVTGISVWQLKDRVAGRPLKGVGNVLKAIKNLDELDRLASGGPPVLAILDDDKIRDWLGLPRSAAPEEVEEQVRSQCDQRAGSRWSSWSGISRAWSRRSRRVTPDSRPNCAWRRCGRMAMPATACSRKLPSTLLSESCEIASASGCRRGGVPSTRLSLHSQRDRPYSGKAPSLSAPGPCRSSASRICSRNCGGTSA